MTDVTEATGKAATARTAEAPAQTDQPDHDRLTDTGEPIDPGERNDPSDPGDPNDPGEPNDPGGGGDGRPWWRRVDRSLLVASLVIAVGMLLVVRGLAVGITGDERAGLPDLIEEVDPVPEAVQVLSQTRVFVDLQTGFTGVLVVDGIELETTDIGEFAGNAAAEPGDQIDLPATTIYEGGNATLTFVPNSDAAITEFTSGEHRVQVIYWRIDLGRERARSFTWTFNVV